MSREELAERLNHAYDSGDAGAYAVLEQHLLDKASTKELRIDEVVHTASTVIGKALDAMDPRGMERILKEVYDVVINLDDELNATEAEPEPAD